MRQLCQAIVKTVLPEDEKGRGRANGCAEQSWSKPPQLNQKCGQAANTARNHAASAAGPKEFLTMLLCKIGELNV